MWVLVAIAWVGVVAAGSAVTWVVIDRAGQQVTAGAGTGPTQPPTVGTVGPAPTAVATRSRKPSATPTSTPSAGHTSTTAPSTPTSPSARPPKSSPAVHTVTRTWSGAPGTVTVSCTGGTAQFKGASPNDGWTVERGDDGGVEVTFRNGESEVQVHATCVAGEPRFQVETGTGSSDH
jgi:hypothetical protein